MRSGMRARRRTKWTSATISAGSGCACATTVRASTPQRRLDGPTKDIYGMAGMHERATLVGGTLSVWSEVDFGTEAELTIPASIAYAKSAAV